MLSTTPKSKHCPASKESSGRLLQLPFLFPASPCVGFISNELYRIWRSGLDRPSMSEDFHFLALLWITEKGVWLTEIVKQRKQALVFLHSFQGKLLGGGMNNIAQDIYVCEGLFYKLMNRIFFFQMLLCFWVTEYCSSLPRFCAWHLICYRKWIFPLIWIFCSDSLLGGHDEWRNVPGGLCLAKWMRGHRLLGTCRYCVTWCRSGCECLWEAMLGTSLTQVWKHTWTWGISYLQVEYALP